MEGSRKQDHQFCTRCLTCMHCSMQTSTASKKQDHLWSNFKLMQRAVLFMKRLNWLAIAVVSVEVRLGSQTSRSIMMADIMADMMADMMADIIPGRGTAPVKNWILLTPSSHTNTDKASRSFP